MNRIGMTKYGPKEFNTYLNRIIAKEMEKEMNINILPILKQVYGLKDKTLG